MPLLEICCFDNAAAAVAMRAGADRIEFCTDREAGGVTPALDDLIDVTSASPCPVFAMVRPRGGDFVYTGPEFAKMKDDLVRCSRWADGLVFGCLDESRRVDVIKTSELVRLADGLPCTFHRAFDEVADPVQALEDVISTGCRAVLTSGTAPDVLRGVDVLSKLVVQARSRIDVMPGGGVRSNNILSLRGLSGCTSFHSSGILNGRSSPDADEIRAMRALIHRPLSPSASLSGDSTAEAGSFTPATGVDPSDM